MFTFFYNFFLLLHSVLSSSCKRIYYLYLYVIVFSFLSKSECTNKPVSQVLCLERLQSQTHFLRFETKLSQFFFFLLFPELHITFQLCQGFCLLEDSVKLLFCVTTSFKTMIHFSTQRSLVKILEITNRENI